MSYYWPMPSVSNVTFDGRYFDQIFPPDFFGELADLMDIDPTKENLAALRRGHYEAFSAFAVGTFEHDNFQALKDENTRLDRVAKDAEKLLRSLSALHEFGQTQTKLRSESANNPTGYADPDGPTLASILNRDRPNDPFHSLKEILSDLWISASRAKIVKPKSEPMPVLASGGDLDLEALEAYVLKKDWAASGNDAVDEGRWKKRSDAHRLPSDHALVQFIRTFKLLWQALSPHPFTQGHYYDKIGHDSSRTVAALKLCFVDYAPGITPQTIVTAIRKVQSGA